MSRGRTRKNGRPSTRRGKPAAPPRVRKGRDKLDDLNVDRLGQSERIPDDVSSSEAVSGRLGRTRDRALDACMRMLDGVPAEIALDQTFRRARDLGSKERATIRDAVYGVARSLRRIDDRLERAAKACRRDITLIDAPVRARLRLLAYELGQGASLSELEANDGYAFKRIPSLFEKLRRMNDQPVKSPNPAKVIGIEHSLPDWLAERLVASFGAERAEQIAITLEKRAPLTLRANRAKISRDELLERIQTGHGVEAKPTPLSPDGIILASNPRMSGWDELENGLFELQDEGSQLISLALGVEPGHVVVDACAGAGGKTLAIGSIMKGSGRILSFDPEANKLAELKRRTRRAGLNNVECFAQDFGSFSEELRERADRVLVDAPCTGSGRLRRQPDARWRFTEKEVLAFPSLQLRLLLRAIDAVRPGGLIVYATCSLLEEENEQVVQRALESDLRIRRAPLSRTLGPLADRSETASEMRLGLGSGPDEPDGFFIALLERV